MQAWISTIAAFIATWMGAASTPPPVHPHPHFAQRYGTIVIPKLDVRAPIREGTAHHAVLDRAVGHSRRSDWPGEGGTSLWWGHNVTPMLGRPYGIFHFIDQLRRGDKIKLRMPYGKFSYTVRRHWIIPVENVASFFRRYKDDRIYLAKCYPDESSDYRYIVLAKPM